MLSRNHRVSPSSESIEIISLKEDTPNGREGNGHAATPKKNIERMKLLADKYQTINKDHGNTKVLYKDMEAIFHDKVTPFRKTKSLTERKRYNHMTGFWCLFYFFTFFI